MGMIKTVLFVVAIGWTLINLGGLAWAIFESEPLHAGIHFVLTGAFAAAAYLLRPRRGVKQQEPAVAALEDEIDELQRKLNEKQEGLDFAEQLLTKRPEPRRVDDQGL